MSKKFKPNDPAEFASAVRDSAQQIWLAGLGAFVKAQKEGQKMFDNLVKHGNEWNTRGTPDEQAQTADLGAKMSQMAGEFQKQAAEGWGKLEQGFEERVTRSLGKLGVPTKKDLETLTKQVEELSAAVAKLSKPKAARKVAKKAVAKTSLKKAPKVKES